MIVVGLENLLLAAFLEAGGAVIESVVMLPSRQCSVQVRVGDPPRWGQIRTMLAARCRDLALQIEELPDDVTADELRTLLRRTILKAADDGWRDLKDRVKALKAARNVAPTQQRTRT